MSRTIQGPVRPTDPPWLAVRSRHGREAMVSRWPPCFRWPPWFRWPLWCTGCLLLALTQISPAAAGSEPETSQFHSHDHGHDHETSRLPGTPAAERQRNPRGEDRLIQEGEVFRIGNQRFADLMEAQLSEPFRRHGLRCGTAPQESWRPEVPGKNVDACSLRSTKILEEHSPQAGDLISIPVVVHVVHREDGTGRISEELIQSQIQILREDFRALPGSPGAGGIDSRIDFQLATVDPGGYPTDGILYTAHDGWHEDYGPGSRNPMKAALAWDPDRYLNLYINDAGGTLGYASSPHHSAGSLQDGVVLHYTTVGRDNPAGGLYDQGRTATHEVGHYLGLFHTFQQGCGDPTAPYRSGDLIADTAPQSEPNWHCAAPQASCGSPDADDNYMNYTEDRCMGAFTAEQIHRMRCTLAGYRPHLGAEASAGARPLLPGQPLSDLAADRGEELRFVAHLPPGSSNLEVRIEGGDGDADLYLRHGAPADAENWDCRPYRNGSEESCIEEQPAAGPHFVTLRAYRAFSGLSLVAQWETQELLPSRPPQAQLDYRETLLAVVFEDLSKDPDGRIVERRWSFGDGTSQRFVGRSGLRVVHVYPAAGTYSLRLEVLDDAGNSAVTERQLELRGERWDRPHQALGGLLDEPGAWRAEPDGGYYGAQQGEHRARLTVPAGALFSLELFRWENHWELAEQIDVQGGAEPDFGELSHLAEEGYFYLRVVAQEGDGPYLLELSTPPAPP
ncbi:MAG: M43 family zinc metalloprotease [Acidobacteriota bacterium]